MRTNAVVAMVALCTALAVADEVTDIISQATIAEYQAYLRVLTGVDPVQRDPDVYLTNRYSYGDEIQLAGDWLEDLFSAAGLSTWQHKFDDSYGRNVIGELPGTTRAGDIYIISGHYDTYHAGDQDHAPGCDDDGTGTAAAVLAARILSQYEFEGTIRFLAFAGEEQWMVGSQAYARLCKKNGDNVVAVFNLDMILHPTWDNRDPDPDHDIDLESDKASRPLADFLAEQFGQYTMIEFQVHEDPNDVSDHWAFWQYGYHAVGLSENTTQEIWSGTNDAYHQLDDTVDNPDFEWDFALEVVRGAMAGLINQATLRLDPPPCPGDLNCDGAVDFDDIDPFVLALTGKAGYRAQYPDCHWLNADCNQDRSVDFGDIDPFVELLGSSCP